MRLFVCAVLLGAIVASCGSSTDTTSPTTYAAAASTTIELVDATTAITPAGTTSPTGSSTSNQTVQLPDPVEACGRLESAVAAFSPVALGQDPPVLVPAADGIGFGCSMTWQEQPPNSTLLRANLLIYPKEKMTSEMARVGYSCDPTPNIVPGWEDASTCNQGSGDAPVVLVWLDKDGQSISLSFRGEFAVGATPHDVADALVLVLGPRGTVDVTNTPVTTISPPSIAPPPSTVAPALAVLPSATWDGKYVAEPTTGPLRIGQHGSRVKGLQNDLGSAGLLDPPYDGYFGPDTEQAVVTFQQGGGFKVDGIAGTDVQQALRGE
ncbi:MAG: peptidoglycan-binding domain-containing protein [Ilumatobacteraceae bacterium]